MTNDINQKKTLYFYNDIREYGCSLSMALDEINFNKLSDNNEFISLRYYKLKNKSLTLGKFQDINTVKLDYLKQNNIEVARRITGGRGVFHCNDIIISAVFNKNLFNYKSKYEIFNFLPNIIKKVLTKMKFSFNFIYKDKEEVYNKGYIKLGNCFSLPVSGELCYKNMKFLGVASYIVKEMVLQQASLQLNFTNEYEKVFKLKKKNTYYTQLFDENIFFLELKKELSNRFYLKEVRFNEQELLLAEKLAKKRYLVDI